MLDLHCHILPGVDDGPRNLDEALTLARFCVRDGITHVTATPHCHRHIHLLRAEILPHVVQFNETLRAEGIRLEVLPGSEIQVFDAELYRREYQEGLYCHLGDNPAFTLLEFSWQAKHYPVDAPGHVRWLLEQGSRPIIAHPERHEYMRDEPDRLQALVDAGAFLQITVDSLLGNHGPEPFRAGWEFVENYTDVVLATDAHGPGRCSGLSAGYQAVRERLGDTTADELRERSDRILEQLLKSKTTSRESNSTS